MRSTHRMKQTTPGANIKGLARIQAGCVPSGMLTDSGEKEEGISEDTSETGWERGVVVERGGLGSEDFLFLFSLPGSPCGIFCQTLSGS